TLTPMLCSRLLKPIQHGARHNAFYRASEAVFQGMLALYRGSLGVVLRYKLATLLITFLTVGLSGYLFAVVPKGFFPIEDTGLLFAVTEVAQDSSFAAMWERQKQVEAIAQDDPTVDCLSSTVGVRGPVVTLNHVRVLVS